MSKLIDKDMKSQCLIKSDIKKKCMMCENQSEYIEYLSEAYFCSTECIDEFYKLVFENEEGDDIDGNMQ